MPIAGTRQEEIEVAGNSYRKDPLYQYAKAFSETAQMIASQESADIFTEPTRVYKKGSVSRRLMKNLFMESCVDPNNVLYDAEDIDDLKEMQEVQFENDVQALREHTFSQEYAPVVGMAVPVHKLVLMNNVFDKGGIQKVTAQNWQFPITLERRILVAPDGTEYDMYLEQNMIATVMDQSNPTKDVELTLPVTEDLDIVATYFGGTTMDALDISTFICAVEVENVQIDVGDPLPDEEGYISRTNEKATEKTTETVWFRTDIRFTPNYGGPQQYDRATTTPLEIHYKDANNGGELTSLKAIITGSMNKSRLNVDDLAHNIKKIRLRARLDTANAMIEPPSTKWKRNTDVVEIGTSNPIATTISPVEVKDVAASYHINTLTKHMSMFKTVMSEYKDFSIKKELDESYKCLDERNGFYDEFDFAPRFQYSMSPAQYRQDTFMDFLDHFATQMLQVLNDPNMTFTIFGDPEVVRRITPKDYNYSSPSSIGAVTLDYTQTIVNVSDKRVYNFIGSDKMRNTDELMIILNPRNSERIIYRIYDYQLYVSNEIRHIANPALPAIYAFERWKFVSYMPVQGRVKVLNQDKLYRD